MSAIVPIVPIVHVVGWRVHGATPRERQQQADAIVAAVEATRGQIPGMVSLDVGRNIVEAPDAWDVGAVMVFGDRADLEAYQTHPAHLALKAVIGPLRSARCQLDFERKAPSVDGRPTKGTP